MVKSLSVILHLAVSSQMADCDWKLWSLGLQCETVWGKRGCLLKRITKDPGYYETAKPTEKL